LPSRSWRAWESGIGAPTNSRFTAWSRISHRDSSANPIQRDPGASIFTDF
jgi:hypothetical protein